VIDGGEQDPGLGDRRLMRGAAAEVVGDDLGEVGGSAGN
jgi:hypothetical protein